MSVAVFAAVLHLMVQSYRLTQRSSENPLVLLGTYIVVALVFALGVGLLNVANSAALDEYIAARHSQRYLYNFRALTTVAACTVLGVLAVATWMIYDKAVFLAQTLQIVSLAGCAVALLAYLYKNALDWRRQAPSLGTADAASLSTADGGEELQDVSSAPAGHRKLASMPPYSPYAAAASWVKHIALIRGAHDAVSAFKARVACADAADGVPASSLHPELPVGLWACFKRFFWPRWSWGEGPRKIPDAVGRVQFPARLFAAILLGAVWVYLLMSINVHMLDNIQQRGEEWRENSKFLDRVSKMDGDFTFTKRLGGRGGGRGGGETTQMSRPNGAGQARAFLEFAADFMFGFRTGLYAGVACGSVAALYTMVIIFRAYRQKIVEFRLGATVNDELLPQYAAWRSCIFIGVTASYIATGAAMVCYEVAAIVAVLTMPQTWALVSDNWDFLTSYAGYFIVYYCLLQWFILAVVVVDSTTGQVKPQHAGAFRWLLLFCDFLYLPFSLLAGLYRVLFFLLFVPLSYMRPDLSPYPGALAVWDSGHLVFVSTARMAVDCERAQLAERDGAAVTTPADTLKVPGAEATMETNTLESPLLQVTQVSGQSEATKVAV
eukprot:TRINITY_DN3955_c1_g1_i1.p1 TRINITY_DN3955_c1_g1~~TRINITY_DN3955_c1_g1_i1.p1  ORF type:complete len:650 (+),score=232.18 TRINITY_DN3955_c1_g1_i1:128-1951(+)